MFKIFKEKAGVISEKECWVAIYPGYLHVEDTYLKLVISLLFEYKHDKHLAG